MADFIEVLNYLLKIDRSKFNLFEFMNGWFFIENTYVNRGRFYLQKFLYLINTIHLGIYATPLFDEMIFSAFENGPHIKNLVKFINLASNLENEYPVDSLNEEHVKLIATVYERYNQASFLDLWDLMHNDIAWLDAFRRKRMYWDDNYKILITPFKKHYQKLYKEFI